MAQRVQATSYSLQEVESEAKLGKMFVSPVFDTQGRAIVYMKLSKDVPADSALKIKYLVWVLEEAIRVMRSDETGIEKMVWLADFTDSKIKFGDTESMRLCKEALSILQAHYPERLGLAVAFNPPTLFKVFWKVLKGFIDPVTRQKIMFVDKKRKQTANRCAWRTKP